MESRVVSWTASNQKADEVFLRKTQVKASGTAVPHISAEAIMHMNYWRDFISEKELQELSSELSNIRKAEPRAILPQIIQLSELSETCKHEKRKRVLTGVLPNFALEPAQQNYKTASSQSQLQMQRKLVSTKYPIKVTRECQRKSPGLWQPTQLEGRLEIDVSSHNSAGNRVLPRSHGNEIVNDKLKMSVSKYIRRMADTKERSSDDLVIDAAPKSKSRVSVHPNVKSAIRFQPPVNKSKPKNSQAKECTFFMLRNK